MRTAANVIATSIAALWLGVMSVPAARAAALEQVAPEAAGFAPERLARLGAAVEAEVAAKRLPGAVIAISRRGKLAYFQSFGSRDPASQVPMPRDAIFSIASMTKPMASVAVMMLHDEAKLFLSDPIGKHLPEMADMKVGVIRKDAAGKESVDMQAPKRQPTIQDLLRHTAGITYGGRGQSALHKMWPQSGVAMATTMSGKEFATQLGKLPLLDEPGTVWDYGHSTDVLGLVVEAVAKQALGAFLEERLWKPLGMADTSFALPDAKKPRYALAFANDPLTGKPQSVLHATGKTLTIECGGACAVSTALDYLRFAEMLLTGGVFDGKRVLPRKTVEYMTSDHLTQSMRASTPASSLAEGLGFGLGFSVRSSVGVAQVTGSAGEYGWGGAYGTAFWVDPKEQMALVYMSAAPGEVRNRHRVIVKNLVLQAIAD